MTNNLSSSIKTKELNTLKYSQKHDIIKVRKGCVDMWNAFMVRGAAFTNNDIPYSPTTAFTVPVSLVSYEEAKTIHKNAMHNGHTDYIVKAFVHFFLDDQKFDGKRTGIWWYPEKALEILRHFAGVITPDFSTNADFPEPIKRYNFYRMRAFGYWLSSQGIPVINNVRWGTEETWNYCWDGVPHHSIVAVGTVASGLKLLENRPLFENGLNEMVRVLQPHTIIVYGSANYECFNKLKALGINIVAFPSQTSIAFERRKDHE